MTNNLIYGTIIITYFIEVNIMAYCYNKLWKLLIDKNMKKTVLKDITGMGPSTLARLSKNEEVSLKVLGRICKELNCDFADIIEYKRD